MHIVPYIGQGTNGFVPIDPVEAARELENEPGADVVDISAEALETLQTSEKQRVVSNALSLPEIQARIDTVRSEIEAVWNSALPDREKHNLVSAKENEIALLRAGQFAMAGMGFSRVA